MTRSTPLLLTLLGGCGILAASTEAQNPVARITYVATDSVGISLPDSGYILLIEYHPGTRPRVLFPDPEVDWVAVAAGSHNLRVPIRILRHSQTVLAATPQCVVRLDVVSSWRLDTGPTARADGRACGPLPRLRSYDGGYGPWDDWATPHYDFSPIQVPYLLLVVFATSNAPLGLAELGTIPNGSPVDVALRTGSLLSGGAGDSRRWQAALWLRR